MKKITVSESGAIGITSEKGADVLIINPEGRVENRVERIIEDKDVKFVEKIKKDAMKEIRRKFPL